MMPRPPIIPTIIVLGAVGVMIWLGLWQLERREQKAALLTRYHQAVAMSAEVPFPADDARAETMLYRHARLTCARPSNLSSMAGANAEGDPGLAVTAECDLGQGNRTTVVLGWSRAPVTPDWRGGEVRGVIAPPDRNGPRLIAALPLAGLEANALPDPSDISDNHLAYAVQWFFFAAAALVIYALALARRARK
ncbi:MAG TPA: SURF1 family protein [Novosphingobium sp.]|nr:SURF1 family protein [Novosphingobium sp.]